MRQIWFGEWGADNNIITTYNFVCANCFFCAALMCRRYGRRETIIELYNIRSAWTAHYNIIMTFYLAYT